MVKNPVYCLVCTVYGSVKGKVYSVQDVVWVIFLRGNFII